MATLAALAFGGEPALTRYMHEKPKSRQEAIVSKYMWSEIFTGAAWSLIMSLSFLLTSPIQKFFAETGDPGFFHIPHPEMDHIYDKLFSGYFALFIFLAVFNAFNARTEKLNLFDNIGKNKGFLKILGIITVVQVLMIYVGGKVMNCVPLSIGQWAVILIMAISIIPVDLIRKAIVNPNKK